VYDLKNRLRPERVATIPSHDARGLAIASLHLFIADGAKGLTVADVSDPRNPVLVSTLELAEVSPTDPGQRGADRVAVCFQHGAPRPGDEPRTPARQVAAIAGSGYGLHLVDVTEPSRPIVLHQTPTTSPQEGPPNRVAGLHVARKFDLGSTGGGIPSTENDYAYLAIRGRVNMVTIFRITDPTTPVVVGSARLDSPPTGLAPLRIYNPPFLVHYLAVSTERGLRIVDVTRPEQPQIQARIDAASCSGGCAVEAMPLDRMITEEGVPLKDIAHEPARYVDGQELRKLLRAKIPYNAAGNAPK
jgi:hypothetical protein